MHLSFIYYYLKYIYCFINKWQVDILNNLVKSFSHKSTKYPTKVSSFIIIVYDRQNKTDMLKNDRSIVLPLIHNQRR